MSNKNESEPSEPQTIIEAADSTADMGVLSHLWELTKHRLVEEKGRHDSARDRAGKYIGYSFSVLASVGGVLVLARDLIKDAFIINETWLSLPLLLMTLLLIIVLMCVAISVRYASKALASSDYRTWDEDDLKKVHLGGQAQQYAYYRYLIKAAWNLMQCNTPLNDTKIKETDNALRFFSFGALAAIIVVLLVILTNGIVGRRMAQVPKPEINLKVECMSNSTSKPSPNPTSAANVRLPKPQSIIPRPTPKPGNGKPHTDGINTHLQKKL